MIQPTRLLFLVLVLVYSSSHNNRHNALFFSYNPPYSYPCPTAHLILSSIAPPSTAVYYVIHYFCLLISLRLCPLFLVLAPTRNRGNYFPFSNPSILPSPPLPPPAPFPLSSVGSQRLDLARLYGAHKDQSHSVCYLVVLLTFFFFAQTQNLLFNKWLLFLFILLHLPPHHLTISCLCNLSHHVTVFPCWIA